LVKTLRRRSILAVATGLPKVPDCEPRLVALPRRLTRLEELARELEAPADELRAWLAWEVEQREREPVVQRDGHATTDP
jgi:hypothetical protein